MEIDNLPILGTTVDKSQVPPIHQKRILAFVNHFITSTCKFLNDFILSCENKFIDIERKIQRVEASLIIIESKVIVASQSRCPSELQNPLSDRFDSKP